MWWGNKTIVQNVEVVVDQVQVDQAVARIEAAIRKLDERKAALEKTIREAKTATGEVNSAVASAKRRGRGGW